MKPGLSINGKIEFSVTVQLMDVIAKGRYGRPAARLKYQHGEELRDAEISVDDTLTISFVCPVENGISKPTLKDALKRIKEELE